MEEFPDSKTSMIQKVFLTRLGEYLQRNQAFTQELEKPYNEIEHEPLPIMIGVGIIFTTVFSLLVFKIGIVYAILVFIFIFTIMVLLYKQIPYE